MNPACPKCGFSYAWDGNTCGHCHHRDGDSIIPIDHDDLFEVRFTRKAIKNRLTLFSNLLPKWRDIVLCKAGDRVRGRPVLAFISDADCWTLLTTRQVLSCYDNQMHDVAIESITRIRPALAPNAPLEQEKTVHWKDVQWEYLRLYNNSGSTVVWVPPGNSAWALWNLLLPVVRSTR
jgi:hypothetical protein